MDKASQINPEMRIRFTSPHPKDFPDELLQVMRYRPNLCKSIHIPAQSGSTTVLDRMRRGYSRYVEALICRLKIKRKTKIISGVIASN
jgi:tRNA A37 methylthiotransferase MiaB